jgi:hypothetical protein
VSVECLATIGRDARGFRATIGGCYGLGDCGVSYVAPSLACVSNNHSRGASQDVTAPMPLITYVAFCRALEPNMPVAACDEYRLYGDSPADAADLWAASQKYGTERADESFLFRRWEENDV